ALGRRLCWWPFGLAEVALPALVAVAVAGGITGPRRNRLQKSLAANTGPLPNELATGLRHPLLVTSWRVRAALLLGLVFVMTTKMDSGSVWLLSGVLMIGIGWSLPVLRTPHAASVANPEVTSPGSAPFLGLTRHYLSPPR